MKSISGEQTMADTPDRNEEIIAGVVAERTVRLAHRMHGDEEIDQGPHGEAVRPSLSRCRSRRA
jgi:hypothetical protein